MHPLLGEVAPAAPALLEPLLALLFFMVALGLITLVSYLVSLLVQVLDRTVGKLPGVGGIISDAAHDIAGFVTSILGSAVSAIDRDISFWWHALSTEAEWIGREIENTAGVVAAIASIVQGAPNGRAQAWIRAAIHLALRGVTWLAHEALRGVKALEKQIEHAEQGIIARAIHFAISPILGRLGVVEKWIGSTGGTIAGEINSVIEPDIAALKQRATAIENQAIRVYQDAAGVWHVVNTDAMAAAVAVALTALGLGGLNCGTLGSALGSRGCGLWSGLDDLLGLIIDALILTDICEVLPLLESAASDIAVPAVSLLTNAIDALPCVSGSEPPPLNVPKLYLDPAPALSLSLP